MAKALGIGGIFFKAEDPATLGAWYARWLGLPVDPKWHGATLNPGDLPENGYTVWSPFARDTTYFAPSEQAYMINLIVDDVDEALAQVAEGGATLAGEPESNDYGRFGWFLDPEGNKVELWKPSTPGYKATAPVVPRQVRWTEFGSLVGQSVLGISWSVWW